jgi:hypothetical protein
VNKKRDTTPAREPELAIQKQWSEVRRGTVFTLLNGASLRVLSPGRWNRMPGPDFRGVTRPDLRRAEG